MIKKIATAATEATRKRVGQHQRGRRVAEYLNAMGIDIVWRLWKMEEDLGEAKVVQKDEEGGGGGEKEKAERGGGGGGQERNTHIWVSQSSF